MRLEDEEEEFRKKRREGEVEGELWCGKQEERLRTGEG